MTTRVIFEAVMWLPSDTEATLAESPVAHWRRKSSGCWSGSISKPQPGVETRSSAET